MLLSLMRKHAQSWLIKVIIAIIAVVFVLYFGTMRQSDRNAKTAMVNGELITTQEYQNAYHDLMEAFQNQYKDLWNDDLIKALDVKNLALRNLINQILIEQEAHRLGLAVTDDEIRNAVMGYAAFQINGRFDMGRYQDLLGYRRMTPEDFEEILRQELLNGKLKNFLAAFSNVSDPEVQDDYRFNNEKIKISFVRFGPDNFKDAVQTDESGLKDYFEEHKERYRVPRKIKITYLEIDPESFEGEIEIPDKEILSYYEYHMDTYAIPKQVRARHILFKLDENAPEEKEKEIKDKAQSVLKEVREGKDFSELAKKHSEDTSRSEGGDLGYFPAGRMVKPFEDAVFNMKSGEISDLVRTPFGYHIIKVEDIKEPATKTLEEVRPQILKTLTTNTTADLAYEKGQTLIDQMPYDADLAEYATGLGLQAQHTDYLTQDETLPVIGGDRQLKQRIFALEKKEISDLLELNGRYYIFQVSDLMESSVPEMETVAERVKQDYRDHLAGKEAKKAAQGFLEKLKNGSPWEALAGEQHLTIEQTGFFTRQGSVPNMGYLPGLQEATFKLNADNRYPDTVFENDRGTVVVRWEAYEGVDEGTVEKGLAEHRRALMQNKHNRVFENWIQHLNQNADIEIITPP